MSGKVWYVIHEYAIYDNPDEILHTWKVMGRFESKGKAEREALELAFNEYCKDKPMRFPKNQRNKNDLKLDDKINIVTSVLYNIQQSTNASNKYNGIGFFVINSDDIKINKNVINISDINKMFKHPNNQQEGQVEEVNEENDNPNEKEDNDNEKEENENPKEENENPKEENENPKEENKPLPESKFKEYSDEETEVDKIVREYSQRKDPHISYLESQLKFDKRESETESESEFESESDYSTDSQDSKEESDNESGIE